MSAGGKKIRACLPRDFADFRIRFPPLFKGFSVFHGRAFACSNNTKLVMCLGFPDAHVAIVGPRDYESRIG